MMNPVIMPVRNNLHLTKKAIESLRHQDIPVDIVVIDNASSDGTAQWLATQNDIYYVFNESPASVAASWNMGLKYFFIVMDCEYCLVVNNDVELMPQTYRYLLADGGEFVTAVGARFIPAGDGVTDDTKALQEVINNARPHPDFSCYLIRRTLYEKVGEFDENFKIAFCEDGDYDLRMNKAGYKPRCIGLPFLHHGSMTVKNSDPAEIRKILLQADENRKYFKQKWGFAMASPEYYNAMGKGEPTASNSSEQTQ